VELLEQTDENDGLPEIFFSKSGDLLKLVCFQCLKQKQFFFCKFL